MSIAKPILLITGIFLFCSPSLAASDEEIANFSVKMSAAFKCAIYAHLSNDLKEQQRLFQIGLKAGRDYVEAWKSRDPTMGEMSAYLPGASTDFLVGSIYDFEAAKAYDEVGVPLGSEAETKAKLSYRKGNCSLIQ